MTLGSSLSPLVLVVVVGRSSVVKCGTGSEKKRTSSSTGHVIN